MSLPTYTGTADAELGDICAVPHCAKAAALIVLTRYGLDDDRRTALCERHGPATVAVIARTLAETKETHDA